MLGPALRERFGLSSGETGVLLAAVPAGIALTLYLWGLMADRIGERAMIYLGLRAGDFAVASVALAQGFALVLAAALVAGLFAASANATSGRAVMGWFGRAERGTALRLRQMSTPLGGAVATVVLPLLLGFGGLSAALLALAAVMLVGGILAGALLCRPPSNPVAAPVSSSPAPGSSPVARTPSVLRDRRIWRLSLGNAPLAAAQLALVSFFVL